MIFVSLTTATTATNRFGVEWFYFRFFFLLIWGHYFSNVRVCLWVCMIYVYRYAFCVQLIWCNGMDQWQPANRDEIGCYLSIYNGERAISRMQFSIDFLRCCTFVNYFSSLFDAWFYLQNFTNLFAFMRMCSSERTI